MKKINVVKKSDDFQRIIKKNKPYKTPNFLVFLENVQDTHYHFGISASKKLGNAVVRNKMKRRVRSILDEKDYKNGFNCIIIIRKEALRKNYDTLKSDLHKALSHINIYKGEKDEKES